MTWFSQKIKKNVPKKNNAVLFIFSFFNVNFILSEQYSC